MKNNTLFTLSKSALFTAIHFGACSFKSSRPGFYKLFYTPDQLRFENILADWLGGGGGGGFYIIWLLHHRMDDFSYKQDFFLNTENENGVKSFWTIWCVAYVS